MSNNLQSRAPRARWYSVAIICVFVTTLLCGLGAFSMAMLCGDPLTASQSRALEMLNDGWVLGLGALMGLLGGSRVRDSSGR
jgi:hypothetical protein